MSYPRCLTSATSASLLVALAAVSAAQQTPPVPTKTLPESQPPGASVGRPLISPRSGFAYAIRVDPEALDSDEGDRELEREMPPSAAAPAPPSAAAPAPPSAAPKAAPPAIPKSEFFQGTARKAAKLAVANAPVVTFNDLKDLIATLPAKQSMVNHTPPITTQADSGRVSEENRNVRVLCWLYAASQESDNDYHLILGRAPGATPPRFMTMELSGLPPVSAASFPVLKGARDAYNNFFGSSRPGVGYDFYPTPIPVRIEGSLFFDMTHATGTPPGPSSLRPNMPTIWEVHPITKIDFEPLGPPT